MHNNNFFLQALAAELTESLLGYKLEVCFSQDKDELILGFSTESSEKYIKCVATPSFACLYMPNGVSRARKNTVELWPNIYGNNVLKVRAFNNERAIEISLDNNIKIVFTFFGNRPNVLIFENSELISIFNNKLLSDKQITLDSLDKDLDYSLKRFTSLDADYRKTFLTLGKHVFNYLERNLEFTNSDINGKFELIEKLIEGFKKPKFHLGFENDLPVLSLLPTQEDHSVYDNALEALNAFFIFYQKEFYFKNEKNNALKTIEKEIKKISNYIFETERKLLKLSESVSNDEIANVLMANLHLINHNIETVTLSNFYDDNKEIKIKLKKDLNPQKNAENYYRKSKNEKVEINNFEQNIATAKSKLENQIAKKEALLEVDENKTLKDFLKTEKPSSKAPEKASLFKVYTKMGYEILVGKNSKNNDILTFKYATKNDLWLHARDCAGSHVVIKTKNNETVPDPVIEIAASLAAYFSKKKNENTVSVIVTPRKFIRKAKGLKDGEVIVDKETIVLVAPELPI